MMNLMLFVTILLISVLSVLALASSVAQHKSLLVGDWAGAKAALRNSDCCVISVSGLEDHLRVLQEEWADGPKDVDLRARVRVRESHAQKDCLRVRNLVSPLTSGNECCTNDPCNVALEELARGVASLADGPLEGICEEVFMRVVCASDYRAHDPMFHTDKAPLRGYVTLRGPGTEFMTRPSTPVEYMMLRGMGTEPARSVRCAEELEFIVMKGDHYKVASTTPPPVSWIPELWQRASACVHRSPPAATTSALQGRRVIISLDLGDGDDDREWHQINTKREWRSGMTQRKSRLVA
mmetsp:Transcript_35577/g.42883  ORF Transcript_35577/g.42883 Transcript_35577/m.42883 type:complete len:295 (+) Transcript_35577:230-1114(+)